LYIENLFFNRVFRLGNYNAQTYRGWELELVRRLSRNSPLTSVKTIPFRDMRAFTSAKNRLQSDVDGILLVPAVQAFRFHVSLRRQAGVGSGWMNSFR